MPGKDDHWGKRTVAEQFPGFYLGTPISHAQIKGHVKRALNHIFSAQLVRRQKSVNEFPVGEHWWHLTFLVNIKTKNLFDGYGWQNISGHVIHNTFF